MSPLHPFILQEGHSAHMGIKDWIHDENCLFCGLLWYTRNRQHYVLTKGWSPHGSCLNWALFWWTKDMPPYLGTNGWNPDERNNFHAFCHSQRTCSPFWEPMSELLMGVVFFRPSCGEERMCSTLYTTKLNSWGNWLFCTLLCWKNNMIPYVGTKDLIQYGSCFFFALLWTTDMNK